MFHVEHIKNDMSRTVADILFRARFDAGNSQQSAANLSNSLNSVGGAATNAGNGIQGMGNQLQSIIGGNLIAGAISKIASSVVELGKATIQASMQAETLKKDLSFFIEAKTGDKNLGSIIFSDLKQFAAENPVANLKTSIEQTRDLIAKGFGTREAFELVRSFTDITAGNVDQLNSLSYVLGEIRLKGKITGQEIAQFSTGGVNIVELASKLPQFANKSLAETKKLLSESADAYGIVTEAILKSTQEGGQFFGRSESAAKTLTGAMAALEDATFNLQSEIGDKLNPTVAEFVRGLTELINEARTFVSGSEFTEYFNEISVSIADVLSPLGAFYDLLRSDAATSTFKDLAGYLNSTLSTLGSNFQSATKTIQGFTAAANVSNAEGLSTLQKTAKTLAVTFESLFGDIIGTESTDAAIKKSEEIEKAKFESKEKYAKLIYEYELRDLKDLAVEGAAIIDANANKRKISIEEFDKIVKAKSYITQRQEAGTNQVTILGLEKYKNDLTRDELEILEQLGGFGRDLAKKESEISESARKENEKKEKERKDALKKLKEYKDKSLEYEVNYGERLEEVIRRNNQTIDTLRKNADTPLEKQLISNKNAYDNAIAAADKFAAEIVEKEKDIQKELGKIPSDIATEIEKSNGRIATIRAQAGAILSLENTKAYKEQQEKIQAIFEDGENQITQLRIENDSKRLALIELNTEQQLEVVLKASKAEEDAVDEKYRKISETERKKYKDLGALGIEFEYFSVELEDERREAILSVRKDLAKKQFEIIQNGYKEQVSELEKQNNLEVTQLDTQNTYLLQSTEKGSKERFDLEIKIRKEAIQKQIEFEAELQAKLSAERIGANKKDAAEIDQQIADSRNRVAKLGDEQQEIQQQQLDKKKQDITNYLDAVKQASETIFSIFNTINDAQIAAIDKQITAQSKRVDRAKELAEKGNADLLQIEQNRLDQLEAKKRKAAERQILINRAQQISAQLLAVAQIAASEAGTGPLAPILIPLAIASVLASMAAGFVEAQALEHGTQFVDKEGRFGSGVDRVPAQSSSGKRYRLNRGEAVIPTSKNEAYRDVINGIFTGAVPPQAANDFFKNYRSSDFSIPSLQNITVIDNSNVVSEMQENNRLMKRLLERQDQINIVLPNGKKESLSSRIDWLRNKR